MNQSINESINQTIKSMNQSINQSNHSINQSIRQSTKPNQPDGSVGRHGSGGGDGFGGGGRRRRLCGRRAASGIGRPSSGASVNADGIIVGGGLRDNNKIILYF